MVLYLFDIDGTILLTGGCGTIAINQVFARRHAIEDAMTGVSAAGKTDGLIFAEIFERRLGRAATRAEIDALIEEYAPALEAALRGATAFQVMPHVLETIDWLQSRAEVILGIATGNVRRCAMAKLAHIDLCERFSFGGYGDDADDRPGLVARAIERGRTLAGHEVAGERIVVVGDTPRDVAAARACGVAVVAVATGSRSRDELAAAEPDAVFDTLAELPGWHQARFC